MTRSRSTQQKARATTRGAGTSRAGKGRRVASSRPRTASRPTAPARAAASRRNAAFGGSAAIWWGAVITVTLVTWTFYPVLRVQYREQKQRARLAAELTDLRARNDRLLEQVDRLKTPEGVEDVARETLGMVREGEHAYVVVEDTSAPPPPVVAPDRVTTPTETVWTQVLDAVFGIRD